MEEPLNEQIQPKEGEQTLGFWAKLGNIFASPTKTFEALDNRPSWFWPFIIMIVVSLISAYLTMPQQMKIAVEGMMSQGDIPPEQLEMAKKAIPISIMVMSVLMAAVWFFLFSAIYYLFGSIFLGGNSTYKKVLSVQAWTSFIMIVSLIVRIPLVKAKDSVLVSLSPAMILPSDYIGSKLYTVFSQFDFFNIWYLIIFGLGFSYIYSFSKTKSYSVVIICWIIWVAVITMLTPSTA